MSETLWYYTVSVEHIAGIMQSPFGIFEGDGKTALFTSNDDYQIGKVGQQYRIQVSRQAATFSSYKDLESRGKTDPADNIKAANPEQWFGTFQPVSSDKWISVEKLTNDGWTKLTEREKQRLRDLDLLRATQKTLETKKEAK